MIALKQLARVVLEAQPQLAFTTLEIGALPLEGQGEPAHQLLDAFPGSRVIAFELDKQLCAELNRKAKPGMRFYPAALGRTEEERPLYETRHPMCTSLYKPNEALLERYFNLEFAMLKSVSSVRTVSLDRFAADNAVPDVDFIKIDVQGAETQVIEGGARTIAAQNPVFIAETGLDSAPTRLLSSFGYEAFAFDKARLVPRARASRNAVFVHPQGGRGLERLITR